MNIRGKGDSQFTNGKQQDKDMLHKYNKALWVYQSNAYIRPEYLDCILIECTSLLLQYFTEIRSVKGKNQEQKATP